MHTVIYHNNCYDGVTAAWVMYKYLTATGKINEPAAKFKGCNYSDAPPWDLIDDANVYIVDFSWPRPIMEEIYRRSKSLIILDHHKTAQEALVGFEDWCRYQSDKVSNVTVIFDMNRSGAGLAWDYFMTNDARPPLVDYVEDRDLWKYALPSSREFNAYIQSFDIDLEVWIDSFGNGNLNHTNLETGIALLRQQSKLVRQIAEHARMSVLPSVKENNYEPWYKEMGIYVHTTVLMSEVCEQMLANNPEANYAWYDFQRKDGKIQVGLRSRAGSDVDVSAIAKLYGGGGHKHAAGFEL